MHARLRGSRMNYIRYPQEVKLGCYFQSNNCLGALETHVFSKFSSVSCLYMACT